jgi:hypothetical protein
MTSLHCLTFYETLNLTTTQVRIQGLYRCKHFQVSIVTLRTTCIQTDLVQVTKFFQLGPILLHSQRVPSSSSFVDRHQVLAL